MRLILLVAALAVMGACGGGGGCGMGAMADTAGWQVVDAGPFVFKLPRGYVDEMPQGVDSYIGRWTRGGRWVSFDYGQYTDDPRGSYLAGPHDRLCTTRIHGRGVVVKESEPVAQDGRRVYVLSGWWRGRSPDGPLYAQHLRLSAGGPADDREARALASTILRTVRIRTRWSDQDRLRMRNYHCDRMRAVAARGEMAPDTTFLRECPTGPPPPPVDYESVR